MVNLLEKIIGFHNLQVDPLIINKDQVTKLVYFLLNSIEENIDGDVVEFGCYVGESSKYLTKTILEVGSSKKLYVYDSFEGLPNLSNWEVGSGWQPGTLKTSEDVLVNNFINNKLPIPIIHKDWFKNIPNHKLPDKICFAFLDGDFYESIFDSLEKIYDLVQDGGYICFHDYKRKDLPGVSAAIEDFFSKKNIDVEVIEVVPELGIYRKNKKVTKLKDTSFDLKKSKISLVTGLWNLGRDKLNQGWSRSYQHYLEKLDQLLKIDTNLIIFGDQELKNFVSDRRSDHNTQFILRDLTWFKNNEYYDLIQNIRVNPKWCSQSGWLPDSTQAKLEMYNPLVMSKMFLLNDARIVDKFNSDKLFWIDAGLTNTVHYGYFTHDKVLDKIEQKFNKFNFICFPYDGKVEIHGFEYKKMCEYSGKEVDMVARGGFFGGDKEYISELNSIYYHLLLTSLKEGFMGTEESLFTILTYKCPDLINYYEIENNGLLGKFFEDIKNDNVISKNKEEKKISLLSGDINKTSLYVIGFNSPNQLKTLIQSMLEYDKSFIEKPTKYLLNNSTDRSTDQGYEDLCNKYGFTIIDPKSNLGICGGRQYIAEHFDQTDSDFMFFFEDDMFFYPKKGEVCKNGLIRYVDNLYHKSLKIAQKENFDFLKLNFTEFFGDNSIQWSWYNVPQSVREELWPLHKKLPQQGLDPNAPKAKYDSVRSFDGVPYVTGEIYYCNWPQIVSKEGNKKMFLETKWAHPYEQTWMSYMYQETVKGNLKPGLLLMTPTEHNRFDHYSRELRKES
jgi:O-methyltransferase